MVLKAKESPSPYLPNASKSQWNIEGVNMIPKIIKTFWTSQVIRRIATLEIIWMTYPKQKHAEEK